MAYIEMKHCYKRYQVGDTEIVANRDVNFEIEKGELVIILGASGAGKSTVLNLLGGMDTNDEGEIWIDGANIADYSSHQRTNYRRNDVGFVFQFYKGLGEQFHLLLPYANPQEGQGTFFFPSDQLFQLDKVFYAGIGYLLVFGIVYSIGRLLGLLLHLIPSKKLGGKLFQVSAGILSMLVTLFVLQMALTILATIPMAAIQNPLEKSIVAKHIIQSIPVTTSWLKQIWVTNLIG